MNGRTMGVAVGVLVLALGATAAGLYLQSWVGGSTTGSSTTSGMQGVVTGYVTASPSQPTCTAGQSCDENMTGYSLVFTPQCSGSSGCAPYLAPLSPGGHYSALLPEGTYTVTGLSPSCPWVGCSSTFPRQVTVVGGMQLVENFDISTGIA